MHLGLTYIVISEFVLPLWNRFSQTWAVKQSIILSFLHTYMLKTNRILPFLCRGQHLNNQIFPCQILQTPLSSFFNLHTIAHLLAITKSSFQGHINALVDQCGNGKHHLPDSLEVYGDNTIGWACAAAKELWPWDLYSPEITALRLLCSVSKSFWKNKGIFICWAINIVFVNLHYQRQTLVVLWHKNS